MGKSRKITKFFALAAAAAMLVTSVPVMGAGQESAETTQASPWESSWQEGDAYSADGDAYQIYPIPQSIEYTEGSAFILPENVDVVAGSGINQAALTISMKYLRITGEHGQMRRAQAEKEVL